MLMQAGIAYDSETARAICASLTAGVVTGESYATSAEMAAEAGHVPRLRLKTAKHAARDAESIAGRRTILINHKSQIANRRFSNLGDYESLDIHPVPIDHTQFQHQNPLASADLLAARD